MATLRRAGRGTFLRLRHYRAGARTGRRRLRAAMRRHDLRHPRQFRNQTFRPGAHPRLGTGCRVKMKHRCEPAHALPRICNHLADCPPHEGESRRHPFRPFRRVIQLRPVGSGGQHIQRPRLVQRPIRRRPAVHRSVFPTSCHSGIGCPLRDKRAQIPIVEIGFVPRFSARRGLCRPSSTPASSGERCHAPGRNNRQAGAIFT